MRRLGTSLCGRYTIVRLIGMGGMAAVYAGFHRNGHAVAIKILHDGLASDPEVERLFRREAQLANRIGHPGVVPVVDDDVTEDGCTFLVMPLLEGETVRARAVRLGGKLPVGEAFSIGNSILGTLGAAHTKLVVHRDIKPENLFVTMLGEVKILDFGIGRFFELNETAMATHTGRMFGTPAFMAPEQALGKVREVSGQTDIWAVGATLFYLLSGECVHPASNASEASVMAGARKARLLEEVAPEVPEGLRRVVDRALAFEKADRWRDAEEMARALAAAWSGSFGGSLADVPRLEVPQVFVPVTSDELATAVPAMVAPGKTVLEERERTPGSAGRPADAVSAGVPTTNGGVAGSSGALSAGVARWGERKRALVGAVGISLLLTASLGGVAVVRSRHAPLPATSATTQAPAKSSLNPEAAVHYSAGLQAWNDAALHDANVEFEKATQLDPTLAAAHLRLAVSDYWLDDGRRAHYLQAARYRQELSESDRQLLDAYEPMLAESPQFQMALERLTAIVERSPGDMLALWVLQAVQLLAERFDDAWLTTQRMMTIGPSPLALAARGFVSKMRGDHDEAEASLQRCVDQSPRAAGCWHTLLNMELATGECVAAERNAHRALAVGSVTEGFSRSLAKAILGRGGPVVAARSALRRAYLDDASTNPKSLNDDAALLILEGRGDEAIAEYRKLGELVGRDGDSSAHLAPAYRSALLLLELGRTAEAVAIADDYLRHRDAWAITTVVDDALIMVRIKYFAGTMTRDEFIAARDAWLRTEESRSSTLFARTERWMEAYPLSIKTRGDAEDAIEALALTGPLTDSSSRTADEDDAIGNMYLLAGRLEEALPHLSRSVAACSELEYPTAQTIASLHFGEALEQNGETKAACAAYRTVVSRWGGMKGSRSAAEARARMRASCRD